MIAGSVLDRIEAEWERLLADLSTDGTIVCQFCNASDVTDDDHRSGCPVWKLRARYAALVAVARAAERVDAADADGQFGLLPLDGDACQALEALSEALSRLDPAAAGKDTA